MRTIFSYRRARPGFGDSSRVSSRSTRRRWGSLIEVVNRFGSFFYGSILGVFLLAMVPRAGGRGAFVGLIAGMTVVGFVNFGTEVAYLWQNIIGAGVVLAVGVVLSGRGPAEAS